MKPYIIIIILSLLAAGCAFHPDDRLVGLDDLCDSAPQAVLDSLTRIDRASLGEADRHYYDFLSVKATDKAYITHSSDSLILSVVDYASNHQSHGYYPEALYYCGRVYSDQGDYPTALTYFHQALDQLPEGKDDKKRGNMLSQIARLLITLRLYDEAEPYLNKVIEMDIHDRDTLNWVYDLELLGHLQIYNNQLEKAEKTFNNVLNISGKFPEEFAASKAYLAVIKYRSKDNNTALKLIRGTHELVDSVDVNFVLANYSRIYLSAGLLDSAYMYAHKLIKRPSRSHKATGYNRILTPELRQFLHPDTAFEYMFEYVGLLEKLYNENQNKMVISQMSAYNYKQHDINREKAEKSRQIMLYCLIAAIVVILIISISLLYIKNKSQKNLINMHVALARVEELKNRLENNRTDNESSYYEFSELRQKLRAKILEIDTDKFNGKALPEEITESEVYRILNNYVKQNKAIPSGSELWRELENLVFENLPNFKKDIEILAEQKLTPTDRHTLALIKCGFSATDVSILSQRQRSSINSRRKNLAIKLFGEPINISRFDALIRLI